MGPILKDSGPGFFLANGYSSELLFSFQVSARFDDRMHVNVWKLRNQVIIDTQPFFLFIYIIVYLLYYLYILM